MPTVHVELAERSYDVIVENGSLQSAGDLIQKLDLDERPIAIISDDTVASLHAETLEKSLQQAGFKSTLHTVPAGEASKSLSCVEELCRDMTRSHHDRNSLVVALGGGVVGDLAGFVASIFFRGVPFVQIPTTIVSQVDSSVGGKTGVNIAEGKNLVGRFHQPRLVIVDPDTLTTLGTREFQEGFAEAIKHAAIRDAAMIDELTALDPESRDVPAELIARNIAIKARIVEEDEQETQQVRALLNFGHTIGHGIEAAVPYGKFLHGEAIALGLRAALYLSERHEGLDRDGSAKVLDLLKKFNLPQTLPESISTEAIMEKIATDKKFSKGAIRFVLLDKIGHAKVSSEITSKDLIEAIAHLRD